MRMLEIEVPEYFVTHIGHAERLGASCVRMVMCAPRRDVLEPRYSCVWPIDNLLLCRSELIARIGRSDWGVTAAH